MVSSSSVLLNIDRMSEKIFWDAVRLEAEEEEHVHKLINNPCNPMQLTC